MTVSKLKTNYEPNKNSEKYSNERRGFEANGLPTSDLRNAQ